MVLIGVIDPQSCDLIPTYKCQFPTQGNHTSNKTKYVYKSRGNILARF